MAASRNRQKEIFLKALDIAARDERDAFVARVCDGDEVLRRQIVAMLEVQGLSDNFLEQPAAVLELTVIGAEKVPRETAGTRIGPYKLLEQIGEGGMGVVFMAEQQEPVRRLVALKIIKPGMDSGLVLARFEAERQALALMDHPNIAKVLDAGATAEGRPYFVMELVKGTPITKFCDERRLTTRERLELFVLVCQAIQHAHQKGVIHRDIKPSNVLVALYDDKAVPKVIDFGIAKATGQPLTERTLNTGFGNIVGTPEYMSPEQATFNELDIDTRSDVYALGVVLYELLTGTTPVDKARLKEVAILEVLRLVREEEPARPSLKLSTSQARATIAATRGTEAGKLSQLLRGELDWIVMKSLEKDRNRRYDTAANLARDVDRYLKNELVEARPPSLGYRLRKSIRRNRGPVLAVTLVLLTLLGGVIGTTVGMFRAWDAEGKIREANKTIQVNMLEVRELNKKANKARDAAVEHARWAHREKLRAETARHAIHMDLIYRAWERHDTTVALHNLNEVPAEFQKTWEWRYLRDLCFRRAIPVEFPDLDRHNWTPWPISPDGKSIAAIRVIHPTIKEPPHLKVWDAKTGKEKWNLAGVRSLTFSRNSQRLAVSIDNELKILDAQTGREQLSVKLKPKDTICWKLAFSPDDKLLATSWQDGLLVLDAITGTEKFHNIQKSGYGFGVLAFDADGKRLAAGWEQGVKIFDVESGQEKHALPTVSSPSFFSVSFSPDGKRLLQCKNGPSLSEWDIASGRFLRHVPVNSFGMHDAGYTMDGKAIVLIGDKHNLEVKLIDVETGQVQLLPHPLGPTTCATLSQDGQHVARSGGDLGVLAWTVGDVSPVKHSFQSEGNWFLGFTGSTSNKTIATGNEKGLSTWDLETGQKLGTVEMAYPDVRLTTMPMHLLDGGKTLACYVTDVVKLLDTATGRETQVIPGQPIFSPDGKRIAFFNQFDGLIKICDRKTGREELTLAFPQVFSVAFSPNGERIAAGSIGDEIAVWETRTGKLTLMIQTRKNAIISFFPDNRRLLTYWGGVVKVWDAVTGEEQALFRHHEGGAHLISPDGTRIFVGRKVYDAATGQELFTLPSIADVRAISPDGSRLVTTPTASRVEILEAP